MDLIVRDEIPRLGQQNNWHWPEDDWLSTLVNSYVP
jgi:hypothetical protein